MYVSCKIIRCTCHATVIYFFTSLHNQVLLSTCLDKPNILHAHSGAYCIANTTILVHCVHKSPSPSLTWSPHASNPPPPHAQIHTRTRAHNHHKQQTHNIEDTSCQVFYPWKVWIGKKEKRKKIYVILCATHYAADGV